jgi:hypothetical protein
MKTQAQMYYDAERKSASLNEAMLEALYGPNPITDEELAALIRKRPETYGRFAGYIGKRSA